MRALRKNLIMPSNASVADTMGHVGDSQSASDT